MSRTNLSHTGGHQSSAQAKEYAKDAPDGQCWGCWQNKIEPWEHETWCPQWQIREGAASGA